jgi:short subunit dehydrogenase-like uncharacterized protein
MPDWMIYGATGYTGRLVAEEAVRRGYKPLLVGRSEGKLKKLAGSLNLEYAVAPIDDPTLLEAVVRRVKLVYHAAGPFVRTSQPMLRACLAAGAHYLDITGETQVYQNIYQYDSAAQEKGITLLPGVGFDFLPGDCLVKYVADQLPDATHLTTAVDMLGSSIMGCISGGTAQSLLEILHHVGSVARRDRQLVPIPLGAEAQRFQFPSGKHLAMPIPWGDLETGYRTTGIPNMTSYLTLPPILIRLSRLTGGLLVRLLHVDAVRNTMSALVGRILTGPSESARKLGRSYLYAQVRNAKGETREAWLETIESYQFTAVASIPVVERVLDGVSRGALTPSLAFGADFVLNIAGTRHYDSL